MHNTQFELKQEESVYSARPTGLPPSLPVDIDFDAISVEQEYFYGKQGKNEKEEEFIGILDESTEIDSLVTSMASDLSLSRAKSSNLESEEILHILRSNQSCRKETSQFSRSHPEFYNKKISLQGRVLKLDAVVPRPQPLLKARTVPERVSKPFLRNFDSLVSNSGIQY